MESDLRRLTAQTDLQVLFISGNPQKRVPPLTLSATIDESEYLRIYGFGTICAEFVKEQLDTGIPIINGTHLLSKVNLPTFTIDPKASALNYGHNGFVRLFHRFGMLHCVIANHTYYGYDLMDESKGANPLLTKVNKTLK